MRPDNDLLDNFIQQASSILDKAGLSTAKSEVEQALKAALAQSLSKMDIVSREEFDAQTKVLQRAEQRIDALEQQLADLSAQQEH